MDSTAGECVKTSHKPCKENRVPVVEKCEGCNRTEVIDDRELCLVYITPAEHWRLGNCPLGTHVVTMIGDEQTGKKRVGQQKQRKG